MTDTPDKPEPIAAPTRTVFEDHAIFMKACGQSTDDLNDVQADLYLSLVDEEVEELHEAHEATDIVEVADAVCDILVVVIGYGLSLGLPMQALWDEVLRSNLAKIGPDGTVQKREDGKIMKPPGWTPPDIKGVLIEHGFEV